MKKIFFYWKSFYTFAKKLIQIFAPDLVSPQQWLYADLLTPILFPSSSTSSDKLDSLMVGSRSQVKGSNTNETLKDTFHDSPVFLNGINETFNETEMGSNKTLSRRKRFSEVDSSEPGDQVSGNSSSSEMSEIWKNLEYLENDPNAFFKPSKLMNLVSGDRGFCIICLMLYKR